MALTDASKRSRPCVYAGYPRIHVLLRREGFLSIESAEMKCGRWTSCTIGSPATRRSDFSRSSTCSHVNTLRSSWHAAFDLATSHAFLQTSAKQRSTPASIRCDNGTEFVAETMDQWAFWNRVQLDFSRPGKPTDNAFAESFNDPRTSRVPHPSYFETVTMASRSRHGMRPRSGALENALRQRASRNP
jgi:transposase InsO family protein